MRLINDYKRKQKARASNTKKGAHVRAAAKRRAKQMRRACSKDRRDAERAGREVRICPWCASADRSVRHTVPASRDFAEAGDTAPSVCWNEWHTVKVAEVGGGE